MQGTICRQELSIAWGQEQPVWAAALKKKDLKIIMKYRQNKGHHHDTAKKIQTPSWRNVAHQMRRNPSAWQWQGPRTISHLGCCTSFVWMKGAERRVVRHSEGQKTWAVGVSWRKWGWLGYGKEAWDLAHASLQVQKRLSGRERGNPPSLHQIGQKGTMFSLPWKLR